MFNSKGGKFSTRMLLNCEDVPLNWKQIESWLVNDNNIIVDTDLSPFSVNLNKWSKMNVNAAKAPFTWKTRNTLMANLANKLNCGIDIERIPSLKLAFTLSPSNISPNVKERLNDDSFNSFLILLSLSSCKALSKRFFEFVFVLKLKLK